eukprot:6980131-Prymnesium_polylepis.1
MGLSLAVHRISYVGERPVSEPVQDGSTPVNDIEGAGRSAKAARRVESGRESRPLRVGLGLGHVGLGGHARSPSAAHERSGSG